MNQILDDFAHLLVLSFCLLSIVVAIELFHFLDGIVELVLEAAVFILKFPDSALHVIILTEFLNRFG